MRVERGKGNRKEWVTEGGSKEKEERRKDREIKWSSEGKREGERGKRKEGRVIDYRDEKEGTGEKKIKRKMRREEKKSEER